MVKNFTSGSRGKGKPSGAGKKTNTNKPNTTTNKNKNKTKAKNNTTLLSKKQLLNAYEIDDEEVGKNSRLHNLDDVEDIRYHVDEINSEDDEEIDSDEAYSDPEGITASIKIKRKSTDKKRQEVEQEEEEEDYYSELEGEGYVDLSEMLEDISEKKPKKEKVQKVESKVTLEDLLLQPDSDLEAQSEDEVDEEEGVSDIEEDVEQDEDEKEDLTAVIPDSVAPKKQKYLKEQTETYKESEFNLNLKPQADHPSKLSMADLLAPISNENKFETLETKVKQLTKKNSGLLEAPLAKRLQDRVDRVAAYQHSKEHVSEWQPIVNANQEAEHINFNKVPQADAPANLGLKEKPTNEFEKGMEALVKSSKLYEQQIQQNEQLALSKLDPEEVKRRHAELYKMRELMFRNEAKAKRAAKIKSKTYRKLKKNDKEKLAQAERELLGEDDAEVFDAQVARAMERMTLKHKNTSKWAKSLLRNNDHSQGQAAILEQLQEHERLTRKVTGVQSDLESESDEEGARDTKDAKANAFDALDALLGINTGSSEETTKGLMGMKFMKRAEARKQKEAEQLIQEAKDDLRMLDSDGEEELEKEDPNLVQGNSGRMSFQDKSKRRANSKLPSQVDVSDLDEPSTEAAPTQPKSMRIAKTKPSIATPTETNPWLLDGDNLAIQKKNKNLEGKRKDLATQSVAKLKKAKQGNQPNTSEVELNLDTVLEEKEDEPEILESKLGLVDVTDLNAFTQPDLIQMAFADDDVVQSFAAEKVQTVAQQDHQVQDTTLPGWGSWSGTSIPAKTLSKATKVKRGLLKVSKQGVAPEKRKDKELGHVIVNELPNKKLFKYTLAELPHPYKTVEEFELAMANPIGKEWNPGMTAKKRTMPKILKKKGKVILPLNLKEH